jgi:hypothetical protein
MSIFHKPPRQTAVRRSLGRTPIKKHAQHSVGTQTNDFFNPGSKAAGDQAAMATARATNAAGRPPLK